MKKVQNLLAVISITAILVSYSNTLSSQTLANNSNRPLESNFFGLQQVFNNYWENKDTKVKGKGWKQFKRWEWFWGQRLYPTGNFQNPMAQFAEHRKVMSKKDKNDNAQTVGAWTSIGPSSSNGGYAGLGRINVTRENPSNSSIIYAGAAGGGFWISTNSGSTWATTTDEIGSLGVTDIAIDPNNNNIIYIATGDGDAGDTYSVGILKSTDGGSTWNTTGLNWTQNQTRTITRILINPSNSNILYAASSNGIWKSTDAGTNWSQINTSSIKDMEFNPSNPSIIYASKTSVIKTTDAGANWTTISGLPTSGVYRIALAVTSANSNFVYALMANNTNYGYYGTYRSTDEGNSFTQMSTTPNIMGWNTDGSDNGGQGWYDLALEASSTDSNEIYVGGVNLWRSSNGGVNWVNLSSWTTTVHADQHDIWNVPGTTRLYASNDGGVYRSTNSGTNWTWIGSGIQNTQFYRLGNSATNSNMVIGGAQDNGTKLKNGATWSDVIGGDGMECIISHANSNIVYGELYYGQIRKSTNGGSSFSTMTLPSEYNSGYGAWVTPFIQHPADANLMFVGYRNVFKSTDGGSSWSQISNFTSGSLTLLHAAPSNANYIYTGTGSNLYRTTNGGTSWVAITKPSSMYLTYMAINPNDPLKVYATFSGYTSGQKVYYSTNGGDSWTNISGSLPNVPANTIVYQENYFNRVYVGTDVGIYYIDDNNATWQDFNTNLPNVVVNELEIQESSSKLRAATYGRGLWEAEIPAVTIALDPPVLSAPSNNGSNVTVAPTLSWNTVTNATSYTIQYSTTSDFATNIETSATTTSKCLSGLSYNTQYYWRAKAVNGNSVSNWSSVNNYTTVNLVLSAPSLSSPANNATNIAIAPTLSWGAVTNATGYKIQYSTSSDFATYTELTSTTTSKALSGLNYNTTYYWRVKATNADVCSNWSTTRYFKTLNLTLSAPTLTSPANSATNRSRNNLAFAWNAVTNATGYVFQISTVSSFSTVTEYSLTTNSTTLSGLGSKIKYYWRVKATNGSVSSSWSSARNFTTASTKEIEDFSENTIDNSLTGNSIKILPNPISFRGQFVITTIESSSNRLELYNLAGQKVREFRIPAGALNLNLEFNKEELTAGVYMLVLSNEEGAVSELLVIE